MISVNGRYAVSIAKAGRALSLLFDNAGAAASYANWHLYEGERAPMIDRREWNTYPSGGRYANQTITLRLTCGAIVAIFGALEIAKNEGFDFEDVRRAIQCQLAGELTTASADAVIS